MNGTNQHIAWLSMTMTSSILMTCHSSTSTAVIMIYSGGHLIYGHLSYQDTFIGPKGTDYKITSDIRTL